VSQVFGFIFHCIIVEREEVGADEEEEVIVVVVEDLVEVLGGRGGGGLEGADLSPWDLATVTINRVGEGIEEEGRFLDCELGDENREDKFWLGDRDWKRTAEEVEEVEETEEGEAEEDKLEGNKGGDEDEDTIDEEEAEVEEEEIEEKEWSSGWEIDFSDSL